VRVQIVQDRAHVPVEESIATCNSTGTVEPAVQLEMQLELADATQQHAMQMQPTCHSPTTHVHVFPTTARMVHACSKFSASHVLAQMPRAHENSWKERKATTRPQLLWKMLP